MTEITAVLPDFPGFAVQYDESKNPFFRAIVVEDLRKIASVKTGKSLLDQIGKARPLSRGDFPNSINVMIKPHPRMLVQSGHKMTWSPGSAVKDTMVKSGAAQHNPDDCPFYKVGGSYAEAKEITNAGNGKGTVSTMHFSNAPAITSKGETMISFITLAHELIHSLHHVTGTRKDEGEEIWTTGIGIYSKEPMSENGIRGEFNMKLRVEYG